MEEIVFGKGKKGKGKFATSLKEGKIFRLSKSSFENLKAKGVVDEVKVEMTEKGVPKRDKHGAFIEKKA